MEPAEEVGPQPAAQVQGTTQHPVSNSRRAAAIATGIAFSGFFAGASHFLGKLGQPQWQNPAGDLSACGAAHAAIEATDWLFGTPNGRLGKVAKWTLPPAIVLGVTQGLSRLNGSYPTLSALTAAYGYAAMGALGNISFDVFEHFGQEDFYDKLIRWVKGTPREAPVPQEVELQNRQIDETRARELETRLSHLEERVGALSSARELEVRLSHLEGMVGALSSGAWPSQSDPALAPLGEADENRDSELHPRDSEILIRSALSDAYQSRYAPMGIDNSGGLGPRRAH